MLRVPVDRAVTVTTTATFPSAGTRAGAPPAGACMLAGTVAAPAPACTVAPGGAVQVRSSSGVFSVGNGRRSTRTWATGVPPATGGYSSQDPPSVATTVCVPAAAGSGAATHSTVPVLALTTSQTALAAATAAGE